MKRKGILKFIKNCLNDSDYNKEISDNPSVSALMETLRSDLHKHYGFIDIENYNSHYDRHHQLRFSLLYIENTAMTFEDIAEETFISKVEKLKKHIKRYNDLALKVVTEESSINSDYAFLLNEYQKSGL